MSPTTQHFPTDVAGLPASGATETVEIPDGGTFDLRIAPVAKRIGDTTVRMLAYNGSVPGPTLKVAEGSEITVRVENDGDLEATVHWHGLRLDSRYDGTHETQRPMEPGESFEYRLSFPDPGVYWYHPHVRQDYGQELGLYGNILVVPSDPDYWAPAHRELLLTLDDVLVEDGRVAPFGREETNYAAMGRFGNRMLVAGEPEAALTAEAGEVVRLYLTNTANTRVFDVAVRGATMKLVGGDSGRCEREELVESVMLAPSERVVVDVLFADEGEAVLEHRTPGHTYRLGAFAVAGAVADPSPTAAFGVLRTNPEMVAERERVAAHRDREPDKTLAFSVEMEMDGHDHHAHHGHHEHHGHHGHHDHHDHSTSGGIEWEDGMVEMNRTTTSADTRWKLIDKESGAENHAIDWRFRVGDQIKLRLVNEMDSDHPMHHPFHIHGAGRFLVLSRDGVEDPNLVWTDTVLVRTGETVDILLDVTHPGRWMAHCHIAEHHESGMMLGFDVEPAR